MKRTAMASSHREGINVLQSMLDQIDADGREVRIDFNDRPDALVTSVTPYEATPFGRFRNRAPRLAGKVTLRAILATEADDTKEGQGIHPVAILQQGDKLYASHLDATGLLRVIGEVLLERIDQLQTWAAEDRAPQLRVVPGQRFI